MQICNIILQVVNVFHFCSAENYSEFTIFQLGKPYIVQEKVRLTVLGITGGKLGEGSGILEIITHVLVLFGNQHAIGTQQIDVALYAFHK